MCRRSDANQGLAKIFFQDYGLHLLAVPREGAAVGDCYVVTYDGILEAGPFEDLIKGNFQLPQIATETLGALRQTVSHSVGLDVGFSLLGPFLAALGAGGIVDEFKAKIAAKGAQKVSFRLSDATQDKMQLAQFGRALEVRQLDSANPLVREGNQYLVATSVVRTSSLDVATATESNAAVDVDAETLAGTAAGGVKIDAARSGEITIKGNKRLAIAVALVKLDYEKLDDGIGRFNVQPLLEPQHVRGSVEELPGGLAEEIILRTKQAPGKH